MSTDNAATAQLPDVETAYATVIEGVHKQAFLARLEQHGRFPESAEEADALVELGFKLAAVAGDEEDGSFADSGKAATAPGRFAEASQALDRALGLNPQDGEIKQAAFALAHDPAIYGSALVLKYAQARALAAQEGDQGE